MENLYREDEDELEDLNMGEAFDWMTHQAHKVDEFNKKAIHNFGRFITGQWDPEKPKPKKRKRRRPTKRKRLVHIPTNFAKNVKKIAKVKHEKTPEEIEEEMAAEQAEQHDLDDIHAAE